MSGRVWVAALGILAVLGTLAIADDPDTKAKLDQLDKRLDELQKSMPRYGAQGGNEGDAAGRSREIYIQMQAVRAEMTKLMLGPKLAARYDEYRRRQTELSQQYRAQWGDKSLEREARQAQLAEVRKQQTALSSEYAEVTAKAQAITQELYSRRYRGQRLEKLKPLLKVTDAEWQALEPLVREVMRLQNALNRATTRARAYRSGYGVSPLWKYARATTPVGALAETVKKKEATTAEIQAKIEALRKARQKGADAAAEAEKKLKDAREALRELVTTRQEAILIVEGILD